MAAGIASNLGERTKVGRLERKALPGDGHGGGGAPTWILRGTVQFSIDPLSYTESLKATQLTGVLNSGLWMQYRPPAAATDSATQAARAISITDRILLGARTFQITSYQDIDGDQVDLRVLVTEVQS